MPFLQGRMCKKDKTMLDYLKDMDKFSVDTVNHLILTKHHLTEESKINDIVKIAENIFGLHGTNQTTPYLSLFNRMKSFSKDLFDKIAYDDRKLGKIRCMRKTVFILPENMLSYSYVATKKQYSKRQEGYLNNLGVTKNEFKEVSRKIQEILKSKSKSTAEIKKELGISENISAFVNLLCDANTLIRNKPVKSWRDKRHTYSLFSDYFPILKLEEYSIEESIEKVVTGYIEKYGPVTEEDIFWWTGFNKTPVRKVLDKEKENYERILVNDFEQEFLLMKKDYDLLKNAKDHSLNTINILPDLDPYTMGYKNRERYIPNKFFNHVYDRSGNATSMILLNGRVVGVWDFISAKEPLIKFCLLHELEPTIIEEIKEKIRKIGMFIFEGEINIKQCNKMEPLKTRVPGEVMTPLKDC